GWVLGEMEAVAEERRRGAEEEAAARRAAEEEEEARRRAAEEGEGAGGEAAGGVRPPAPPPPPPPPLPPQPPLAVLPLGTGNDLARVLGWGGGVAALEARGGLAAVLAEVAGAAPTPLDRWGLQVTVRQQEDKRLGRSFLPRRRQPPATPPLPRSPPLVVTQVKVFNNYLGVGIDSWCALEFHRMRERYPGWFRSQLGNKMWYTGVGARDLLARSCVDLPSRMQLVCDGSPVPLPPGTQGVLLLNIPSYMGGVNLWAGGVGQQQGQQGPQHTALHGAAWGEEEGGGQHPHPHLHRHALARAGEEPHPAGPPLHPADPPAPTPTTAASAAPPIGTTTTTHPQGPSSVSTDPQPHSLQPAASSPPGALPPPPPAPPPPRPRVPQSLSDGVLEVVAVFGAVHLGKLQVGLARATRLGQCRSARITTSQELPMQVDGEPWMQPPAQLSISLKCSAPVLRRLDLSDAASRLTAAVGEVLEAAVAAGTLTAAQRRQLGEQLARRLGAPHAV
ncbi:hypothetical protein Agub_g9011, partial [Astrephomene gubernaculifera]